ncbi:hypothetical protein [Paenibacillus silvisoli]|uniref:hypothetical protein n=1 Tax=Paenibacillus silvisoli TaxID=3110539 RepID=UPI0028038B3B|nr:hypothetical protein [Paenibacillus silvisoli]
MKSSDPSWYDALQGNPFKESMFTEQAALAIRSKALAASKKNRLLRPGLALIGLAVVGLLGFMLFAQEPEVPQQSILGTGTKSADGADHARSASDIEWEKSIKQGFTTPFLYLETIYTKRINDNVLLEVERELEKIDGKETTAAIGVSYNERIAKSNSFELKDHGGMSASQLADSDTFSSAFYEFKGIPVFFGKVIDPDISQIQVTAANGQSSLTADFFWDQASDKYWIAAFPSRKDGYVVTALDAEGRRIARIIY